MRRSPAADARVKPAVLVTGAAGGVGSHLVKELLEAGYAVRALDRVSRADAALRPEDLGEGGEASLTWMTCDLERVREQALEGWVSGCVAVIHAAARVNLTDEDADMVGPNVQVTRRLVEAARRAKVGRFVFYSCASLYASGGLLNETRPLDPHSAYDRSKRDAEQVVREGAGEMAWTILRPAMIYGPYCRTMSAGAVTLPPILRWFIPYLPGLTGGPRANWCHAGDAARAAVFALGCEGAAGRVLNVADATPLGFGEVMTSIIEAYGLEVGPFIPFPGAGTQGLIGPLIDRDLVFDTARTVLRQLWKRVQATYGLDSPLRPRVDRKALSYTSGDAIIDAGALRALGFEPRWEDFREGIVETIAWYQQRRWAPRYDTQSLLAMRERERERGFAYSEELHGTWTDPTGARAPMTLDLDVEFPPMRKLAAQLRGNLDGTLWMRPLAQGVPVVGTVTLRWLSERALRYEFGFSAGEQSYRFSGQKSLQLAGLLSGLERLEGVIHDQHGVAVGRAQVRFALGRQLVPFLVSLRFLMRAAPLDEEGAPAPAATHQERADVA